MSTFESDEQMLAFLTRPKRILFVEDDEAVRDLFKRFSARYNCRMDVCETGKEAEDRVSQVAYDTIFLDMRLPDISGVDLFRLLSSISPKSMFVVISGYLTEAMMDDITAVGFALFVKKPVGFRFDILQRLFQTLGMEPIELDVAEPFPYAAQA